MVFFKRKRKTIAGKYLPFRWLLLVKVNAQVKKRGAISQTNAWCAFSLTKMPVPISGLIYCFSSWFMGYLKGKSSLMIHVLMTGELQYCRFLDKPLDEVESMFSFGSFSVNDIVKFIMRLQIEP